MRPCRVEALSGTAAHHRAGRPCGGTGGTTAGSSGTTAGSSGTNGGGRSRGRRRDRRGQATVELALALPFIALLLLAIVQVGLVVRDQVLVVHAAREAARAAAVHGDVAAVAAAAHDGSGLDVDRLSVARGQRGPPGSTVQVTVRYRAATDVPLIGALVGDVDLTASAAMRVEG